MNRRGKNWKSRRRSWKRQNRESRNSDYGKL